MNPWLMSASRGTGSFTLNGPRREGDSIPDLPGGHGRTTWLRRPVSGAPMYLARVTCADRRSGKPAWSGRAARDGYDWSPSCGSCSGDPRFSEVPGKVGWTGRAGPAGSPAGAVAGLDGPAGPPSSTASVTILMAAP